MRRVRRLRFYVSVGISLFLTFAAVWWLIFGKIPLLSSLLSMLPTEFSVPNVNSFHVPSLGGGAGGSSRAAGTSEWIVFNTEDPATNAKLYHAKLDATAAPGQTSPAVLELQQWARGVRDASLNLSPWNGSCPADATISARFDNRDPADYAARGLPENGGCTLQISVDAHFMTAVLNAETLVVSAPQVLGAAGDLTFKVGGLTWPEN